jgi:hypothetical protein
MAFVPQPRLAAVELPRRVQTQKNGLPWAEPQQLPNGCVGFVIHCLIWR